MEPMYWLIAMAILLVIEIITMGLTTIWFAAGALAAVVAALFHASAHRAVCIVFDRIGGIVLFYKTYCRKIPK